MSNGSLNFGIIGAGLIGNKRAAAIKEAGSRVMAVFDVAGDRAQSLARQAQCEVAPSIEALVARTDINAVVVATTNEAVLTCAAAALKAGKHVLVEKPAGRHPRDLEQLASAVRASKAVLRVGFNHRFHPALQKAKQLFDAGTVGPLMYIRARYGHGGRIGYDREWRAQPQLSGGGELLDQGVHLIDLCRWLGGEFNLEFGRVGTFFWDMPVEDNGFLLLRSPDGARYATLHASCTEWKNLFEFEIFGKTGKLQIIGLGRSYGVEELRCYKMKPEMGPPDLETWTFPQPDPSWVEEMNCFAREIRGEKTDLGRVEDAARAVEIVYDAYRQSGANWVSDTRK